MYRPAKENDAISGTVPIAGSRDPERFRAAHAHPPRNVPRVSDVRAVSSHEDDAWKHANARPIRQPLQIHDDEPWCSRK